MESAMILSRAIVAPLELIDIVFVRVWCEAAECAWIWSFFARIVVRFYHLHEVALTLRAHQAMLVTIPLVLALMAEHDLTLAGLLVLLIAGHNLRKGE